LQTDADERRSRALAHKGYRVLRFWNDEVLENLDGVLHHIAEMAKPSCFPSPLPSPHRGEGKGEGRRWGIRGKAGMRGSNRRESYEF
jgi:hypothetical protein